MLLLKPVVCFSLLFCFAIVCCIVGHVCFNLIAVFVHARVHVVIRTALCAVCFVAAAALLVYWSYTALSCTANYYVCIL